MLVGTPVRTVAHGSVSVRDKLVVVRAESRPGLVRAFLKDNNHEAAHQEGRVRLLVIIQARVVVDLVVLVLLIVHELF